MPRFALREFSRPDYRGSLPERDPNNAIWPRISAFAKMLHDISWEEDNDDYDDGTGRTEEEREADFEQNASDNVTTSEDKKMDGYSDYLNKVHNDPQTDAELRAEGEEQYRADRDNDVNGGGRDRSGGMDRQRQLAEDAGTGFKKKAERVKDTVESNGDIGEMFPEVFTESPTYQEAMNAYLDQLDWDNADSARKAQIRSEMAGYRPISSYGR